MKKLYGELVAKPDLEAENKSHPLPALPDYCWRNTRESFRCHR